MTWLLVFAGPVFSNLFSNSSYLLCIGYSMEHNFDDLLFCFFPFLCSLSVSMYSSFVVDLVLAEIRTRLFQFVETCVSTDWHSKTLQSLELFRWPPFITLKCKMEMAFYEVYTRLDSNINSKLSTLRQHYIYPHVSNIKKTLHFTEL